VQIATNTNTRPGKYEIVFEVIDSNSASDPVGFLTTDVLCSIEVKSQGVERYIEKTFDQFKIFT